MLIEQNNLIKFYFIQPASTSGDLHVARASSRCQARAVKCVQAYCIGVIQNNYLVYSLFHQARRDDLAYS